MVPEFPEFSRAQCERLRRLHRSGVQIVQVEPFLATLEALHSRFEAGASPEEVDGHPTQGPVYRAERQYTAALLGYYGVSARRDFERIVEALCLFARADAARGRLRESMRARELVPWLLLGEDLYVEAGVLHAGLVPELRRHAPEGVTVQARWLGPGSAEEADGAPLLTTGDRLTLAFARGDGQDPEKLRLLAARSLVQVALSIKDERVPGPGDPFPHARDDAETNRLVEGLSLEDCRRLFAALRSLPPSAARAAVEGHVRGLDGEPAPPDPPGGAYSP
jgi:hypothetical protein